MYEIRHDDLTGEGTRGLLALHLQGMQGNSPAGSVYALDLSALTAPGVTVWSVWLDGSVVGLGALKELGEGAAELKSMRTHPDYLRRGIAAALLTFLINQARTRGVKRLSLETGTGPAFEPALALYRDRGFRNGEAFADYHASDFNQFLHLDLASVGSQEV